MSPAETIPVELPLFYRFFLFEEILRLLRALRMTRCLERCQHGASPHSAHLRRLRLAQVVDELAPCSAFEALGDVGHDAHRCALDLVAETKVLGKRARLRVFVDCIR